MINTSVGRCRRSTDSIDTVCVCVFLFEVCRDFQELEEPALACWGAHVEA